MNKDKPHVDPDELDAALAEVSDSSTSFVHQLKKPINYNGQEILSLAFDFEELTGRDGLEIENEIQRLGKNVVVAAFSGDYLMRMAARVSNPKIGIDAFSNMSLRDFNKIRNVARSFLLASEQ